MNTETLKIAELLKEAYEGEPWYGKSMTKLLNEAEEQYVFEKPDGQHSILELLWHMVNWRQFTIDRLRGEGEKTVHYFEVNDWQQLNHNNKTLWQQGLKELHQTQPELIALLDQTKDELLDERVKDRTYTFRTLLHGIVQHDIYHAGQIAYILKLLKNK